MNTEVTYGGRGREKLQITPKVLYLWVILRMLYYHVALYTFSIFKKAETSCWQRLKYSVYGVLNSLDDEEHWRETYSLG
jgi:uncharacterized membrane protein YesL